MKILLEIFEKGAYNKGMNNKNNNLNQEVKPMDIKTATKKELRQADIDAVRAKINFENFEKELKKELLKKGKTS